MSGNKSREKTNSLTHLTKILIKETMESDLTIICSRLYHLETRELKEKTIIINTPEVLEKVKNSLDNCGELWGSSEDELLRMELQTAFATIAANHGRTKGAIRARVRRLVVEKNSSY